MIRPKRYIPFALSGIAIIEIFLRWVYSGKDGLFNAIHDPGMSLFHLVFLPCAVYQYSKLFGLNFIFIRFRDLLLTKKLIYLILFMIVASSSFWAGLDLNKYYLTSQKVYALPEDISTNDSIRCKIISLRKEFIDSLRLAKENGQEKRFKNLRTKIEGEYKSMLPKEDSIFQSLYAATWHSILGFFEAFLAILFVVMCIITLLILLRVHDDLPKVQLKNWFFVLSFLIPWYLLRLYSETATNLCDPNPFHFFGTFIFSFIAVLLFVTYGVSYTRQDRDKGWIVLVKDLLFPGIAILMSIITAINFEGLVSTVEFFYTLDVSVTFLIELLIAATCLFLALEQRR